MDMLLLSIALCFMSLAVWMAKDKNRITNSIVKQCISLFFASASVVILVIVYGMLGGVLIAIGLLSLVGMLAPFVDWHAKQ